MCLTAQGLPSPLSEVPLDPDPASRTRLPRLFLRDAQGRLGSVGLFVRQEIRLYNNLLAVVHTTLKGLLGYISSLPFFILTRPPPINAPIISLKSGS